MRGAAVTLQACSCPHRREDLSSEAFSGVSVADLREIKGEYRLQMVLMVII